MGILDPKPPTRAELSATYVPKWKAATAYLAGDKVLSPNGDVVSSIADHTSGSSFNQANWNLSATVAGKANAADVLPKWKPNTAYLAGDAVLAETGDIVTSKADHTSGTSRDPANWNLSASYAATKRTVVSDGFNGSSLDPAWKIVRPDATGYRVTGGALQIDTLTGSIDFSAWSGKNIVLRELETGKAWTAETKITANLTTDGQRVGMIAYSTSDNLADATTASFITSGRIRRSGTTYRRATTYQRQAQQRFTPADYEEASITGVPTTWWIRMVWDGRNLIAYDSLDGVTWTAVGRPVASPNYEITHVGVYAMNTNAGVITASFDSFTLTTDQPEASIVRMPKPWRVSSEVSAPSNRNTTDPGAGTLGANLLSVLRGNTKYNLNTWWTSTWASQDAQPYLTMPGVKEADIRPPASAAFGAASLLFTGHWDTTATGVTAAVGRARAIRLAVGVAKAHLSNTPGGWGYQWQSSLWAALAAQAAWLQWQHLSDTDKRLVIRMLTAEANQPWWDAPTFWKDKTGTELYSGDTKAEELAWMAMIWEISIAMLPDHKDAPVWSRKMLWYLTAAWAKQADLADTTTLIHGQPVSDYLDGWNINNNGTLVNHGKFHPDYMASACHSLQAGIFSSLAGLNTPKASTWNIGTVWGALSTVTFSNPPYLSPGGTMYVASSPDIYYPEGNDWAGPAGSFRLMDKAALDIMVDSFGLAPTASPTPAAWAGLHLQRVVDLQARSTTGQVYVDPTEDVYNGREQWVSVHAAWAWLARFVTGQRLYRLSNESPGAYIK